MQFTVENIIVVLTLILSEAWFFKGYFSGSPEIEPVIVFAAALGALFTKDKIKEKFGYSDKIGNHDLELFAEFQRTFPAEPTLRLLKETDFGASFRREDIQPLYNFYESWDSVEKEFLNKKIEKEKKTLYKAAKNLSIEFVRRTIPVGAGDFLSVLPDNQRGGPRPRHVIEDARILNEEARKFVPIYESFVRNCRAILKS